MKPMDMSISEEKLAELDFSVRTVGECTLASRLQNVNFVGPEEKISYFADPNIRQRIKEAGLPVPAFVAAGPRKMLFHDAAWTRAAIVTCGGICPGLNDVIKTLVNTLYHAYGVESIYGIRYGYSGLNPASQLKPMELTPEVVDNIADDGGTILGSSRGEQPTDEMVRTLVRLKINILFTIGGDGTQRGAHAIAEEIRKRGLAISVVGIPKTIDNDLNFMDKTFGFETAVQMAVPVIAGAHQEAKGCLNGVGLVKLMGRDSGFIAAYASLANSVVNFCLIPEVPFSLEGEKGLLAAVEERLDRKQHAVIVVAEGAGQHFFQEARNKDASGNLLHQDIGPFLKERLTAYMKSRGKPISIKYIDPSYIIRSAPANGMDSIFCLHLAQHAVHAAMAGMTDVVVGYWGGYFTYVPMELATLSRRKIDPHGVLWQSVILSTCQPILAREE